MRSPAALPPRCFTPRGHKVGGRSCTTYILPYDIPLFVRLLSYGWKERHNRKKILKDKKVVVELTGSHSSFLLCLMAESSWPTSEVTQEYLQNLVRKGDMMVSEFATYLMPVDPVSPTPAKGFVVVCAAFYEWGFGAPPHRFLCSLLRSNDLELDHLTPLRILHMAAFMTH
jgi:hypothetical protein